MYRLIKFVDKKLIYKRAFIKLAVKSMFIISPFLSQKFIDSIIGKDKNNMILFAILNVVAYIFSQIIFYFDDISLGVCETNSYKNILNTVYKNILFFDEKKNKLESSNIYHNLGQNYELINKFIFENPILCIINFIYLVTLLIMMFRYSVLISLIVMILIPIFILLTKKYEHRFEILTGNWINTIEKCKKYLSDVYKFRFLIRSNNNKFKKIDSITREYNYYSRKKYRFESFFNNILSYSCLNFMILVVNIISGIEVYRGKLSIGAFFALSLYVSHFWTPVEFYVDFYKEYMSKKTIINKFYEFLNVEKLDENNDSIDSLELKDYSLFGITKVNEKFEKGNVYLILGENGSGKTTLFTNILGITERYSGEILINDFTRKNEYYNNIFFLNSEVLDSEFFIDEDLTKKSMGQKKLYYLNCLNGIDADVYLVDEPTNYLQEDKKQIVFEILTNLKNNNKIVLVATHDEFLIKQEVFKKIYI